MIFVLLSSSCFIHCSCFMFKVVSDLGCDTHTTRLQTAAKNIGSYTLESLHIEAASQ